MTDTMLFGILKMPFEMAMKDEISRLQYYARVQELVGRFEAQQQAEPVAWTTMPEAEDWCFVSGSKDPTGKLEGKWFPLYTTPPQRPWVGLTVTTILNMMPSAIPAEYDGPLMEFARAVEAKLKERNGY